MKGLVYGIKNTKTGEWYVGLTERTLEERVDEHIYNSKDWNSKEYSSPLCRAIRQYGVENFTKEVLWSGDKLLTENVDAFRSKLKAKESAFIQAKNSIKNGYNRQYYDFYFVARI